MNAPVETLKIKNVGGRFTSNCSEQPLTLCFPFLVRLSEKRRLETPPGVGAAIKGRGEHDDSPSSVKTD